MTVLAYGAASATPSSAELALAVGQRLLAPGTVYGALPSAWAAASLADGLAGTALMHARLAAADPRFEAAAVCHWAAAGRLCSNGPAAAGIYSGPGSLAASLIIGAGYLRDPERCRAAASRGARWASGRAEAIAGWQARRLARGKRGTPWPVYDVISGLAGIGRVLLAADAAGLARAGPGLGAARDTLTQMILAGEGARPGWWQPADGVGPDRDVAATGLAHGLAGPLAFLTACQRAGHGSAAQLAAISQAADWLTAWRDRGSWPAQVTRLDLQRGFLAPDRPSRRDAWCYGAPGIGRALIAADEALGRQDLAAAGQAALAALAGVSDDHGPR